MRSTFFTAMLILGSLFAVGVSAQESVPKITFSEHTLENGLRLIVHEDHKAPIVAVNVWYHVGSKNEETGKTGFAHLFEHLMFNGSENYDDEYFKPFRQVGATEQNGTTNFDRTNYFQNVPKTALDTALWMESDRMGHFLGAITQEGLDTQRGVVQNEKRQGENQPYGTVFRHIVENVFPVGHPYSWLPIGSMEDLNAASLEDVKTWFETYYGPNNAVLVVAGDVDTKEVVEKVKKYFGDIPPGPPIDKYKVWIPELEGEKRQVLQDRVPQAKIYKVWAAPNWEAKDTDLLDLATDVLGGGKNSRLYERLVYREQIATDVSAWLFSAEIAGAVGIEATVQPGGDIAAVEKALDEELEKFLEKGPTRKELERVRTQKRAAFVRGVEKIGGFGGKSDILAENAVYAGDPGFYKKRLERLDEATTKSVRNAAQRWFEDGNYVLEVHPFPKLFAHENGADRSSVPMPETFPTVDFPNFERGELSNGMNLIVARRTAVPMVDLRLVMDAGYAADQFSQPGTASMTMAMLDEGTEKLSSLEISERLALLGAHLGTGASLDSSFVTMNALTANLDDSLELYADVILNPAFPEQDLARMKKLYAAQIQQEKQRPQTMALRVFPELLYGEGHAYSTPLTGSGTEESIARMQQQDLIEHHKAWFKPNNATLVVVGDTTMAEIKPKLESLFKGWKSGEVPEKQIHPVERQDKETIYLLNRPGAEQSIIYAGHVAPPKDNPQEFAIQALNDVLGGDFTARVNMNLREDKHWAYGAYTMLMDAQAQRPFIGYAPVQSDKTAESMVELRKELVEIRGPRPPLEDELERVRNIATLSLPGRWETAGAVAASISEIVRYDLPDSYWDTYAEQIRRLTVKDLEEAADVLVHPDNLTWVVVGDRAKIEKNIRALGWGDVRLINVDGEVVE
jgi:zinc protease